MSATLTADPPAFAIAHGVPETTRRLRALLMGRERGWWTILPSKNPSATPNTIVFRVRLASTGEIRNLLAGEVLTWVMGYADAHGAGAEFTYREGQ